MVNKGSKKTKQAINREILESRILRSAEIIFAEKGFSGASMERIAERANISKQNLIYYFANKDLLYKRVLQETLGAWIDKLQLLELSEADPETSIRHYVKAKMQLSRDYPYGSKVFAHEIIGGAPVLRPYLVSDLKPQFERDIKVVNSWINKGFINKIDPAYFFFMIWATTQSYADFSTQMEILMGQSQLQEESYSRAERAVTELILHALGASKK
ncbi:TetR/AcrR family transcriptional regulator [Oceanospirillum maris]|uniref:TetR/AcrR family transcriptional regulator n=1 Tax=Oceanospirillum maris TaxID=64977 RepID=UPI00041A6732|nr:TetR/AcrR family transcriptional regulator [Oceanospirillum maris]